MTVERHSVPWIPPARMLKALQLADMLDAAGLGSADVTAMDNREWGLLAAAARTKSPSEQTRALVLTFIQSRESARAAQHSRKSYAA